MGKVKTVFKGRAIGQDGTAGWSRTSDLQIHNLAL
jgi:hypothetical protein